MRKTLITAAVTFCTFAVVSSAQALILSPDGPPPAGSLTQVDEGTQTSQSEIDTYLFNTYGISTPLYKDNVGGSEEGSFAGDYTTVFSNDPLDPMDAVITWDGPGIIGDPSYLLVKDGNQTPSWYLFDVSSWDGTETIFLEDFWPDQGAISHVSIYGGGEPPDNPIPEPATMLLVGTGLAGLAGVRRRRMRKQ